MTEKTNDDEITGCFFFIGFGLFGIGVVLYSGWGPALIAMGGLLLILATVSAIIRGAGMSDIVERIRYKELMRRRQLMMALDEAADEIVRLRAELDALKKALGGNT